nr:hypothetical protein [Kordiimonas gwangyangensis]
MQSLIQEVERIQTEKRFGRVTGVRGLLVELAGIGQHISIGSRLEIETRTFKKIPVEVVGFRHETALAMPFDALEGVGVGCKVTLMQSEPVVFPSSAWLGRVVNALGEPIDGKGPIRPVQDRNYCVLARRPRTAGSESAKSSTSVFVRSTPL